MPNTTKTDPPKPKARKTKPKPPKPMKPTPEVRPALTAVKRRLTDGNARIDAVLPEEIAFQHSVFCQTVLPYRNPGDIVRAWERKQRQVRLHLEAGYVEDPQGCFVPVGLPYGPAARLILCHLNTEALKTGSPAIEVQGSMTAFIARLHGFSPDGRQIRKFKEQMTRLAAATIRLAVDCEGYAIQKNVHIVSTFSLWAENSEGARVLVPQRVLLGAEYFENLQQHAVPLNERAIAALAHSAMALDVYMWLAQRLHRVDPQRGQFIPWTALHEQFGQGYDRIRKFREVFKITLNQALAVYPTAHVKVDKGGMLLGNSPPPVGKRVFVLPKSEPKR